MGVTQKMLELLSAELEEEKVENYEPCLHAEMLKTKMYINVLSKYMNILEEHDKKIMEKIKQYPKGENIEQKTKN